MASPTSNSSTADAPVSNTQRQANALERKINRQHRWRSQVWAACELRIRAMQDALTDLGFENVEIAEVDFRTLDEDELRTLEQAGSDD